MRDSLFRTTRSAVIAALARLRPSGESRRAAQADKASRDGHAGAGATMDGRFICMADCAKDLHDQLHAINRESGRMLAELGDATDTANIRIKVRLRELIEQTARLRGNLDQAVDVTQTTWDGFRAAFSVQSDSIRSGLLAARQCVADHAVS